MATGELEVVELCSGCGEVRDTRRCWAKAKEETEAQGTENIVGEKGKGIKYGGGRGVTQRKVGEQEGRTKVEGGDHDKKKWGR